MLAIALIILGILARCIVPFPNFTPIIAIALFAGMYLPKRQATVVPVAFFVIVDVVLGLHPLILFTWGSMGLVALVGIYFKTKESWKSIVLGSVAGALVFYVVTNFGVWLIYDTYAKTITGFFECYMMALAHLRNTLISTLLYSSIMVGGYELLAKYIKKTRFAYIV